MALGFHHNVLVKRYAAPGSRYAAHDEMRGTVESRDVEPRQPVPGFPAQVAAGPEARLIEGGLGIAIIRSLADELELGERANGRGSRLRFVKLLVQAAPADQTAKLMAHIAPAAHSVATADLSGPVVSHEGRTDVVADQGEVDDLLASLGF